MEPLIEAHELLRAFGTDANPFISNSPIAVEVNENPRVGYLSWHIPKSMLLNLYSDLLYGVGIIKGYYELMVDLVTRGIARERHVVLLDEIDNRHSAIAYMVFKALGFRHVSILNGSKISWLIHKGPLCTCNGHAYKGSFDPRNWLNITVNFKDYFVNFDQVYELVTNNNIGSNTLLIDTRSPCEYIGDDMDIWGHIPGAINMPWNLFLEPQTNRFRDHDEIRKVVDNYGLSPSDDIILYCRTGGRSALVWFVLTELLGFSRVRVYLGSWLDWLNHGAPIKRGKEP